MEEVFSNRRDVVVLVALHALLSNPNVTAPFDKCVEFANEVADAFEKQNADRFMAGAI